MKTGGRGVARKGCMKTRFLFLTSLIFLSSFAGVCSATYIQWDGGAGTSDWMTAANWAGDVIPSTADKAGFKTATGAVVSTTVPTFMEMTLGGNGGLGILTVQPGAVLNCTNTWAMGQSGGEGGVLAMSGGTITVGSWFYVGNGGTGTINMSGGSITVTGLFSIAYAATPPAASSGTVNLDGGTITATTTFSMAPGGGGTARLNITGGRLIINGNVTGTIAGYIANGWIKGYGSASNVRYDYDVTTSGKTTVWAVGSLKATNVSPANGATNIAKNATLSWTAGPGAGSHDVYFGTASPGTFQINQTGTAFNPGQLEFNTTYYWRIDEVNGPNTVTGDVWSFITVSGQAKTPDPNNSAANVAFDKILRWTAGPGAASHDVYFGTTLSDVNNANRLLGDLNGNGTVDRNDMSLLAEYWLLDPAGSEPYAGVDDDNIVDFFDYAMLAQDWMNSAGPVFKGNQDANSFNPGTLPFNTSYYWRIDEVNGPDTAKGAIWSFTTQSGKAFSPSPANSASNVATNTTLSWTSGAGATSHNVYFGTANPPPSQGNQSGTSFNPGTLAASTIYYWRIDEVGGSGTVTGDLWSFTTQSGKAYNPSPANSASNVATNATLSWTASAGAISHDVYFGTTSPGTFRINQAGTTYSPGTLANSTTYYWRIDEVGGSGTITGDVWSFTTVPLSTTPVYPYLTWRNDPTNSAVVNWWNPTATGDSFVDYGLTNSYGSTATVATVTNFHHVELTGLTPSTQYHYRVRSSDGTIGSDMTFTTAEAVADANTFSFSFAVYGDPRGGQTADEPYYTRHQVLCNWILAQNFDFALETGDTVWAGGITSANPLAPQDFWTDFYRLESNLSKSKVIMATMGNHEVQPTESGGSVSYIYYYDLYEGAFPTNGISNNKGRVYSFNYGNTHFVNLSSYQQDLNLQATWLAADLAAARANPNIKWIFAFMHAPMYTTNTSRGNRTDCITAWGPLFDTYHVDVVFAGHNHLLERSKSIKAGVAVADGVGTVYVTTGLGGASFDSPGSGSPGLFVMTYNAQTLATCVTINGNNLTVNSITNADNVVRDTFTLSK